MPFTDRLKLNGPVALGTRLDATDASHFCFVGRVEFCEGLAAV